MTSGQRSSSKAASARYLHVQVSHFPFGRLPFVTFNMGETQFLLNASPLRVVLKQNIMWVCVSTWAP